MSIGINIILVLIIVLGIGGLVTALYWLFYKKQINEQLRSQSTKSKKLLSPFAVLVLSVFLSLFVATGVAMFVASSSAGERIPPAYMHAIYDFRTFTPSELANHHSQYSMYENQGYTKNVIEQGDVRFTYFTSNHIFDLYHPQFIIFAEYIGDYDVMLYGIDGAFITSTGVNMMGRGYFGSEFSEFICIIGTSNIPITFEVTVYFFGEDLQSYLFETIEFAESAIARETLAISISPNHDPIFERLVISPSNSL